MAAGWRAEAAGQRVSGQLGCGPGRAVRVSQRHRPAAPTRHQEHIHEDAQVQLRHALSQQGLRRRWSQVVTLSFLLFILKIQDIANKLSYVKFDIVERVRHYLLEQNYCYTTSNNKLKE